MRDKVADVFLFGLWVAALGVVLFKLTNLLTVNLSNLNCLCN